MLQGEKQCQKGGQVRASGNHSFIQAFGIDTNKTPGAEKPNNSTFVLLIKCTNWLCFYLLARMIPLSVVYLTCFSFMSGCYVL